MGIKIRGTGSSVPAQIVANHDLARILDTSDEWIRTRTGIVTRHILGEGETLTQLGAEAVTRALDMAGINPAEVGLCICCTVGGELAPGQRIALCAFGAGLASAGCLLEW